MANSRSRLRGCARHQLQLLRLCSTSFITLFLQPSGRAEHSGRVAAKNPVFDGQEDSKLLPEEANYSAESGHTEV